MKKTVTMLLFLACCLAFAQDANPEAAEAAAVPRVPDEELPGACTVQLSVLAVIRIFRTRQIFVNKCIKINIHAVILQHGN